jgi:hypothetical protein
VLLPRKPLAPDTAPVLYSNARDIISFPTGADHKPLEVHFTLLKLNDHDGDTWRINVNTKNVHHPYDSDGSGIFFREIMNPALLSAVDLLEQTINQASDKEHKGPLGKHSRSYKKPQVKLRTDGIELCANFNGGKNGTQFYNEMIKAVQTASPEIQKHIDQSAVLQPALNPTQEDLMIFKSQIMAIYAQKMSEISGKPAGTVFVTSDGSRKPLIKGMDIDD